MPKHIFKSKRYVRELRRMALTLAQVSDLAELLHAHTTLVHMSAGAAPPPRGPAPAPAPAETKRSSDIMKNSKVDSCTITHNLAETPLWLEIDKAGDVRVNLKEKIDLIAQKVASLHFGPKSREIVNGARADQCKERLNNLEVISEHSNCSENINEKAMNSRGERKSTHQEVRRVENDNKEVKEQFDYVSLKESSSFLYSSESNASVKTPRSFIDIKITIQAAKNEDSRSDQDDIFEKQPFQRSVQESHDYRSRLADEREGHSDSLGDFPAQNQWYSESATSTDEEYNQVDNYEENQDGIDCQYSPSYVDVIKEETDEHDQDTHLNIPRNKYFLFNLKTEHIIPERFSKEMQTDSNLDPYVRNSHSLTKFISETLIGDRQDRKSLEIISEDQHPISGNELNGSNQEKVDENVYDSSKVYPYPETNIGEPLQNPTISDQNYSAPNVNPAPNLGSAPQSETSPLQTQIGQGMCPSRNPFSRDLMEVDKWPFQWPLDAEGKVKAETIVVPRRVDAWVINGHENPITTSGHCSKDRSGGGGAEAKDPDRKASADSRSALGSTGRPRSGGRRAGRLLGSNAKGEARGRHRRRSARRLDEMLIQQCASLIQLVSQRVAAGSGGEVPRRGRNPRKAKSRKRLPGRRRKAFSTSELQPAWEVEELPSTTNLPEVPSLPREINATNLPDVPSLPREINATNLPDMPSLPSEVNNERIHFKDLFYDLSTDEDVPTIECEHSCETLSLELRPSQTSCKGTHYLAPICKYLFHNLRPYSREQNLTNINVNYYQSELVLETSLDESNDAEFSDKIREQSKEKLEIRDKNYGQNSVNVIRSECSDFIASFPDDNVMSTTRSYKDFAKTFIPQVLDSASNNSVEEKVAEIDFQEQLSLANSFSESTRTSNSGTKSIGPQIRIPTPGINGRFSKEGVRPCSAKKRRTKSSSLRRRRKTRKRASETEIEIRNPSSEFSNDSTTSQDSDGWPSPKNSKAKRKKNASSRALRQTILEVAQNSTLPSKSREGYHQHVANDRDRCSTPPSPQTTHEPVKRRPFLSKMTTVLKCGFSRCSRGSRCLNKSASSFDEQH